MIRAITNSLLSIAIPAHCRLCSRPVDACADGVVCEHCWASTRLFTIQVGLCPKCGHPAQAADGTLAGGCADCSGQLFDAAVAGGVYENALAAIVLELKSAPHLPRRAQGLILSAFERFSRLKFDTIVPVPLSPKRYAERGFNQAAVIAEAIARESSIPIDRYSLARTKHTPMHRVAMDRRAREATVRNAFRVERPKLIQGRSILLVDDVFTSGATGSYCAKALKKSGAAAVHMITLARAVRSF